MSLLMNMAFFVVGEGLPTHHYPLPYERKYPILLPTDSHLTILVIRDPHKSVLHNGVRETIN